MRTLGARSLMAMLAAGAMACAPPASPRVTTAPDMGAPITARLFPPHFGQVAVQVNKPAYIAVFEVIPGRGASLLYPVSGSGFVQVEEIWVPMRYNAQRWIYTDNRTGAHAGYDMYADGRPGYGSHYGNRIRTSGYGSGGFSPIDQPPRYLFLIASEDPIAVERFQGDLSALRRELGHAQYTSLRANETMEEIATALLPYTADDRWAADVYVDWGYDWGASSGYGMTSMFTSMEPVMCSDGIVRYAPWTSGWGFQSLPCTPMQYMQQPGVPTVPPPTQPGDSVVVPPPSGEGRRRADGSSAGERGRATTAADTLTGDAARALFVELRSRTRAASDRSRTAEELNLEIRRDVMTRQRADRARGSGGPVAGWAQPGSRPNVGVAGRPGAGDDASRRAAEVRRRSAESQRERNQDRADERRRLDAERQQRQRDQEAAARRQEQQRQAEERTERSRSTPPAEPSEPAPGRRRVPPAG